MRASGAEECREDPLQRLDARPAAVDAQAHRAPRHREDGRVPVPVEQPSRPELHRVSSLRESVEVVEEQAPPETKQREEICNSFETTIERSSGQSSS